MENIKQFFQPVHRHITNGTQTRTHPSAVTKSTRNSQTATHSYWLLLGIAENIDAFFSFGLTTKELNYTGIQNGKRTYQTAFENYNDLAFIKLALKISFMIYFIRSSLFKQKTPSGRKGVFYAFGFTSGLLLSIKLWFRHSETIQNTRYNKDTLSYENATPPTPLELHQLSGNMLEFLTPIKSQNNPNKLKHEQILDRLFSSEFLNSYPTTQHKLFKGAYLCVDLTKIGLLGVLMRKYKISTTIGLGFSLDFKRWNRWRIDHHTYTTRIAEERKQRRKELETAYEQACPPPPLAESSPKENLLRWMKQWQCSAFFPLYAMGYDFQETLSEFKKKPSEEKQKFQIGSETFTLPSEFVRKVPFFMGFLRFYGESDTIVLSKESPVSPEILQTIEAEIDNLLDSWVTVPIRNALDYLCLDLSFPHLEALNYSQNLLEEGIETLVNDPKFKQYTEHPPSVKIPSSTYPHFKNDAFEDDPPIKVDETDKILARFDAILSQETYDAIKTYQVNAFIQDILTNSLRNQENMVVQLIELIEKRPELGQHITILELPAQVPLQKLGPLLERLPNLLWLSLDSGVSLNVDSLPLMKKLRVIKIQDLEYQPQAYEALLEKIPNVEVSELELNRKSFTEWSSSQGQ